MLIKHLRDPYYTPFGTIVALSPDLIGLSICCPKDHFNKKIGVKIASGRARYNCVPKIPNRCWEYENDGVHIQAIIDQEMKRMEERAKKYFRSM